MSKPQRNLAHRSVNSASAVALLAVSVAWGCAPIVRPPSYQGAATKVTGVSLLGPFDGQIVDADTGEPITDAEIVAVWSYSRGDGFVGADGANAVQVSTDEAGRYRIPRPAAHRTGEHRVLHGFTLFVYKRGYVGYRSDLTLEGRPRRDFTMRRNEVRLRKWRPRDSHVAHLTMLAGPREVRQAYAWETRIANAELLGRGPGQGGGPDGAEGASPGEGLPGPFDGDRPTSSNTPAAAPALLDATEVLSVEDVQRRTGDDGLLTVANLSDSLKRTAYYHGVALQAKGRPASFDLSYRAWVRPPNGMQSIAETFAATLPGITPTDEVTSKTWIFEDGAVRVVAFIDETRDLAALISCGRDQCTDIETVIILANLALQNLTSLDERLRAEGGTR